MSQLQDFDYFTRFLAGARPISRGEFAQVYALPDNSDMVLRVSEAETDGFRLLVGLTDEERVKFRLPKFYHHEECGEFVIMERLYPIDPSILSEEFRLEPNTFNRQRIIQDDENEKVKDLLNTALALNNHLIDLGSYFELDVNTRNIMLRKCGELVLSDPIGWLDI